MKRGILGRKCFREMYELMLLSSGPDVLFWVAGCSAGWSRSQCLELEDGFWFRMGSIASYSGAVEFPLVQDQVGSFWEPEDGIPRTTREPP